MNKIETETLNHWLRHFRLKRDLAKNASERGVYADLMRYIEGKLDKAKKDPILNKDKRARQAAISYLEKSGRYILDADFYGWLGIEDGEGLALVKLLVTSDDLPVIDVTDDDRAEFERIAVEWLGMHAEKVDLPLRMDTAQFRMLSDGRALLRYHIDVIG